MEKINNALEVVLESVKQRQKRFEEQLSGAIDSVIFPLLSRIKSSDLSFRHKKQIEIIQASLNDIFSPFANRLNRIMCLMTATEAQILGLLKHGLRSKEIATHLGVSMRTVETHRQNIRKKLGLNGNRHNLRNYLMSLDSMEHLESSRTGTFFENKC